MLYLFCLNNEYSNMQYYAQIIFAQGEEALNILFLNVD